MRFTELGGWLVILLALSGLAYAGVSTDNVGAGNPRPIQCLDVEQYKKDMKHLSSNLDAEFSNIYKKIEGK